MVLYNYKPIFELPLNACNGRILQLPHLLRWMAGSRPDELIVEIICILTSFGLPSVGASKDDNRYFIHSPV